METPAPASRAALAAHWEREAAFEHASVGAFARASLSLLAVGAPPELLAATHAAAADEVEHARLAYALASAYGGSGRGPGPLAVGGAVETPSIARLAVETFVDGCAGEATAALALREGAAASEDLEVRAILTRIAEDEERHAELAFRTVAWALGTGGDEVARGLDEALAALRDEPRRGLRCGSSGGARPLGVRRARRPRAAGGPAAGARGGGDPLRGGAARPRAQRTDSSPLSRSLSWGVERMRSMSASTSCRSKMAAARVSSRVAVRAKARARISSASPRSSSTRS